AATTGSRSLTDHRRPRSTRLRRVRSSARRPEAGRPGPRRPRTSLRARYPRSGGDQDDPHRPAQPRRRRLLLLVGSL
ncbi:MAG: hypothetical protein AVDCRST_MAG37-3020, partial [uncultured Rubrobacteraceae bacterium]